MLRIIRELVNFTPNKSRTNLSEALMYLSNIEKKRSITFVLSDFFDSNYEQALSITAKKHDVIGIKITDQKERELPDVGLIYAVDAETGAQRLIDTSDQSLRAHSLQSFDQKDVLFKDTFSRSKADTIHIGTEYDYIKALQIFFKRRSKR